MCYFINILQLFLSMSKFTLYNNRQTEVQAQGCSTYLCYMEGFLNHIKNTFNGHKYCKIWLRNFELQQKIYQILIRQQPSPGWREVTKIVQEAQTDQHGVAQALLSTHIWWRWARWGAGASPLAWSRPNLASSHHLAIINRSITSAR
jgi:hypothetical protein